MAKTVIICGKLFDGLGDKMLGPTLFLLFAFVKALHNRRSPTSVPGGKADIKRQLPEVSF
jgi:hypothetical protein